MTAPHVTVTVTGPRATCPSWCVNHEEDEQGMQTHRTAAVSMILTDGDVVSGAVERFDPIEGEIEGPNIELEPLPNTVTGTHNLNAVDARAIGEGLIALADQLDRI